MTNLTPLSEDSPIFVAGHGGMVGAAIVRRLEALGFTNIITRTRQQLDLRDRPAVDAFLADARPEFIFIAAAKVGGIHANNTFRAEFLFDNLMIEANLIDGAHRAGIDRLLFLGSSCIYPREAPQPLREEALLTGPLEWTNEPYAIAKIAGIKLCENYNLQYGRHYTSGMPTNTFGPKDNYHPENSHVMAALIRKAHEAKLANADEMVVWGSGRPLREFIFVDDLADACVFLMQQGYSGGHINMGTGIEVTIAELAETIGRVVGFTGKLVFDDTRPDGTPRKLMDSSKLASLGWKAATSLEEGIAKAYAAAPFYGENSIA